MYPRLASKLAEQPRMLTNFLILLVLPYARMAHLLFEYLFSILTHLLEKSALVHRVTVSVQAEHPILLQATLHKAGLAPICFFLYEAENGKRCPGGCREN